VNYGLRLIGVCEEDEAQLALGIEASELEIGAEMAQQDGAGPG
jgi:hypothetical protein